MAIPAEAGIAIGAPQLAADALEGALPQLLRLHRPGGVTNHREAGAIYLLAGRLPRQQAIKGAAQPHQGIGGHPKPGLAIALGAVEI